MWAAVLGTLRKVCTTLTGAVGLVIVLLVMGSALFAPWVATHNPDALDVMNRFSAPSGAHWFGTDHLGRDLFSRMVHGSRVAMQVSLVAIAIALTTGTALGILAAMDAVDPARLAACEFAGELSLSGELRPVRGALALALAAKRGASARTLVLPEVSAESVGRSPIEPVIPFRTTSAPLPAISVLADGPTRISGAKPARPASRAT